MSWQDCLSQATLDTKFGRILIVDSSHIIASFDFNPDAPHFEQKGPQWRGPVPVDPWGMGGSIPARPPGIFVVGNIPLEAAMSTARITIGGVDISSGPSGLSGGPLPAAQSQKAAGIGRTLSQADRGRDPVSLTVECTQWPSCPLPPGPWRIVGALAFLGLLLCLAGWLTLCRRRADLRAPAAISLPKLMP